MAIGIPKSYLFRACLYPSEDREGYFVAHCLELDLIGEGRCPEEAISELTQAIDIQIETSTNPCQLFFSAPEEIWEQYRKNAGRVILQRIVVDAMSKVHRRDFSPQFERIVATNNVPERFCAPVN
jgi:predicted RNase H-like HicB family nuclease